MNHHANTNNVMQAHNYLPPDAPFETLTLSKRAKESPVQFASILAHEIRNPLSTINLSVEMLKSILTDQDQKIFLDMILRGSMRIDDILTNLHTSLKTDEIQSEKYSIHHLLDEVLAMVGDQIILKDITIRKEYAAKDSKIVSNRPGMKTALTNIIINAIDAMTPGTGELTVVTRSTDHTCVVQIKDNGCGISQENLRNIFKPYFTNKQDGLGLGLAITYKILRSNHVGLNVKSVETKGTSFTLKFREEHP